MSQFIITENRLMDFIRMMVAQVYPDFNSDSVGISTYSNGDQTYLEYYNKDRRKYKEGRPEIYAKYYIWTNELVLSQDLFNTLDDYFGEDMTMVLDWFNKEFEQDATSVTF